MMKCRTCEQQQRELETELAQLEDAGGAFLPRAVELRALLAQPGALALALHHEVVA